MPTAPRPPNWGVLPPSPITAWVEPTTLREVMALMQLLDEEVGLRSLRFGRLLLVVEKRQLWVEHPKYDKFWAWVAGEVPMSVAWARRLMMVAATYSDEKVGASLGPEKAYLLAVYASAKKLDAQGLAAAGAIVEGIPLAKHTRATLLAAARVAAAEAKLEAELGEEEEGEEMVPVVPVPPSEMERAEGFAKRAKAWAKKEGADEAEVVVRRREGRAWVYIQVPADEFELLFDDEG